MSFNRPLMTTKPHFPVLDGLRGMAAALVIVYHVFEGFATSPQDQGLNHGYLAVDFFFILSGFVIGYSYDDRWRTLSVARFFRRRLIRLHPMVVAGTLLGVLTYFLQGGQTWQNEAVPSWQVWLCAALMLLMVPALPNGVTEVRGNGELFPLNGPVWSLFFEYIGNILYALALRRLSTRTLGIATTLLGLLLTAFCVGNLSGDGHLGVGWSAAGWGLPGGLLRMSFSYSVGLLLARTYTPLRVRGALWIGSSALVGLLAVPHLGCSLLWLNGLYDALCVTIAFPCLVWIGASDHEVTHSTRRFCHWAGELSYPLYMVHYPFMYLFYAYVWAHNLSLAEAWPLALLTISGSLLLAYVFLRFYDRPLRQALSKRWS